MNVASYDHFPCLLVVTHLETTEIICCNKFTNKVLGITNNQKIRLLDKLTKATSIVFESYIKPILLSEGQCQEVQFTLLSGEDRKIPVVAHISLEGNTLYWAIYAAEARDKLYQELISTRDHLEAKTEELLSLARKDPLTALLNRRAAMSDMEHILLQLQRSFIPISFILLDIDFFKRINDTFGHEMGDIILVKLSKTLLEASRETDIVARWGGEEFLIVLYNSGMEATKKFSNRLHKMIREINTPEQKGLTVSMGVSQLVERDIADTGAISEHLRKADIALYQAKKNGRARTVFYSE